MIYKILVWFLMEGTALCQTILCLIKQLLFMLKVTGGRKTELTFPKALVCFLFMKLLFILPMKPLIYCN